jgi:catechol 2,3-dioxygenase-like lactoylglutathione lyase family enzyme
MISVDHVAISSPDVDRLAAFYQDMFGFTERFQYVWKKGDRVIDTIMRLPESAGRAVMLELGTMCLELFEFSDPKPGHGDAERPVCDHGITHVCFKVDDLQSEYARLKSAGMAFHSPPQQVGPGLACVYGRDPDGNVIELLEGGIAAIG